MDGEVTTFQLVAIVLVLTSAAAYLNARFWRLPPSIALMATALVGTAAVMALEAAGAIAISATVRGVVDQLDFANTLLHGLLGLMLFAGALHIDLADLGAERAAVGLLALGGTLVATAVAGLGCYGLLRALGHDVRLIDGLVFGALIAPTDPIAVLAMLKSAGAPRRLEVRIAGESLFNDGVGVVIFTVLLAIADGRGASWTGALALFAREAIGGAAFGLATGYAARRLLRTIDDHAVEVLITLTLVVAGYAAAELVHVSAPLGAVVAGLVIGDRGVTAVSEATRAHVDVFWQLVDEILNAVLFVMIGLVLVVVPISGEVVVVAALAVPLTLAARWLSVGAALGLAPAIRRAIPRSIPILTWGGLRGGLSIAMALALPVTRLRDTFLVMTYAVVAFSILIQGLTFPRLLRRFGVATRA
jgi:monovalent cation:H+ antiporter, CPA1 family